MERSTKEGDKDSGGNGGVVGILDGALTSSCYGNGNGTTTTTTTTAARRGEHNN
jgi:hypothetical protein